MFNGRPVREGKSGKDQPAGARAIPPVIGPDRLGLSDPGFEFPHYDYSRASAALTALT